jgi:hypothetical protein
MCRGLVGPEFGIFVDGVIREYRSLPERDTGAVRLNRAAEESMRTKSGPVDST